MRDYFKEMFAKLNSLFHSNSIDKIGQRARDIVQSNRGDADKQQDLINLTKKLGLPTDSADAFCRVLSYPELFHQIESWISNKRAELFTKRTVIAAWFSATTAMIAVIISVWIHIQTRHLLSPTERPILSLRKNKPVHKEIPSQNKLQINLQLGFINIGKHPAEGVRFRSCFGHLSDPNKLKLSRNDLECANTVYPDTEYVPWEQITAGPAALSEIYNLTLFYYCRVDYRDSFNPSETYSQDFYYIYDIDKKKLQHAILEQKQQFQPHIDKLIPPGKN